jgi:ADP-L-glycero-D-manno-heptose 6-epimerase
MIVVTGAAGFIGSCLVRHLNKAGFLQIVAVDDFSKREKDANLNDCTLTAKVGRKDFIAWLENFGQEVDFIFHIGARTDTTEFNVQIFDELNLNYSMAVWKACAHFDIPLVYASSAATYGLGELGYKDDHALIPQLKPLNPYGASKNDFDIWALGQVAKPPFWAGLKFFNVYGPNEYHKGRMASVIFHAFHQISNTGGMRLFRSNDPKYKDGEQLRDFVYVKDLVEVCMFLMREEPESAIYNLGSGKARTFLDLTRATFKAMNQPENISFFDMPEDLRNTYQNFTEADMHKLREAGYTKPFYSLEEGVTDYVKNYLMTGEYF